MFKRIIKTATIAICGLTILSAQAGAQMDLPIPEKPEHKGMQSKSYGKQEELEKLREMVKKNQPGAKPSAQPPEPENSQDQGAEAAPPSTPEDRVWKQYKAIAGETDKPLQKQEEQPAEEDAEDDQAESDEAPESGSNVASLLDQYKNRNKAGLSSRSFARPEEIEKSLKKDEPAAQTAEDPQNSEETAVEEEKQTLSKKKSKSAKKDAPVAPKSAKNAKDAQATGASYNN